MMSSTQKDDVGDVIRRHWNARAATFDRELGHGVHSDEQRQAWLTLLADLAGKTRQRVLDVGCGTGVLSLMLDQLGHSVTGVDVAGGMLHVAREKARRLGRNVAFRLENAASLTDPSESYDMVVARHVLWTMPDPARAVAEWLRVLRPAGHLALIEGKWASDNTACRPPRSIDRIVATLASAASAVVAVVRGRKPLSSLVGKLRIEKYRQVEAQLPFFGGPRAELLVALLADQGLHNVSVEPLMSPLLWGEVPPFPRYLVVGTK